MMRRRIINGGDDDDEEDDGDDAEGDDDDGEDDDEEEDHEDVYSGDNFNFQLSTPLHSCSRPGCGREPFDYSPLPWILARASYALHPRLLS